MPRHSEAVGQEIASIPRLHGSCRVWGDPPLPPPERVVAGPLKPTRLSSNRKDLSPWNGLW